MKLSKNLLILLMAPIFLSTFQLNAKNINLLVFSYTNGYYHESIPTAVNALQTLANENQWQITVSQDSSFMTPKNLKPFDLLILVSPTGDLFNAPQQKAIERFVEKGKALLTIHSGTDVEFEWSWYMNAIAAKFIGHPPTQKATVIIEDFDHPSTAFFPDSTWEVVDEWYSFEQNPRDDVHVLMSVNEDSYRVDENLWFGDENLRMGYHPLVWYKNVGKGVVYQSALGHTHKLYKNPLYLAHLKGAIEWLGNR